MEERATLVGGITEIISEIVDTRTVRVVAPATQASA